LLGVDLGHEELPGTADLLALGLNGRAFDDVAQDDTLRVQLHAAALVALGIVDGHELAAVCQDLPQGYQRPAVTSHRDSTLFQSRSTRYRWFGASSSTSFRRRLRITSKWASTSRPRTLMSVAAGSVKAENGPRTVAGPPSSLVNSSTVLTTTKP